LVFGLGAWKPLNYTMSGWAAAFFAVYEGHQEAIMWLSGSTEPLLLFFGLVSMVCWLAFLNGRGWLWNLVSVLADALAVFSKESAVVLGGIMALPLLIDRKWRSLPLLIPFAAMSLFSVWLIFARRSESFRFQDGSFSLHAPFWLTLPSNLGRMYWVWGL